MAQWIKEHATSSNDLNVTPKTHMVERTSSPRLSSDFHTHTLRHLETQTLNTTQHNTHTLFKIYFKTSGLLLATSLL